jgi:uncharacterized protein (DUF2235 family)
MRPGGKRIALFLDGTWNTVSDNTNIWRMRALCGENSIDGARQAIYYDQGVGTRFGERVRGGMFGYGLDRNVQTAYRWLIEIYTPGDDVFVFGFSRGAFTARSLTGLIARCGLLQPGAPLSLEEVGKAAKYGRSTSSSGKSGSSHAGRSAAAARSIRQRSIRGTGSKTGSLPTRLACPSR